MDASGTTTEVARRAAEYTPCGGDGWYCEAGAEQDEPCTEQMMRAEGLLCVEPWSIEGVAIEGDSMIVLGTAIVAGDGGYPPYHWIVPTPPALRP